MTLLAGLAVQWTGNQQIVFVWAGVMHLLALALFWFWFKGRFVQVNVDAGRRRAVHASRPGDRRCGRRGLRRWRCPHWCTATGRRWSAVVKVDRRGAGGGRGGRVRRDRRRAAVCRHAEEGAAARSDSVMSGRALVSMAAAIGRRPCVRRESSGGASRRPRRARARFPSTSVTSSMSSMTREMCSCMAARAASGSRRFSARRIAACSSMGGLQPARASLVVHRVALRRAGARIPQHLHRGDDAAVLRRARDQLVEPAIRFLAHEDLVVPVVVAHFRDELGQLLRAAHRRFAARRGRRLRPRWRAVPRAARTEPMSLAPSVPPGGCRFLT